MEENIEQGFSLKNIPFEAYRGCCSRGNPLMKANQEQSCAKLSVFNWLKDIALPSGSKKFNCVEIRFKSNHKDFYKLPENLQLGVGDIVVVEANSGYDIGIVTLTGETARLQMIRKGAYPPKEDVKKIYRKAKQPDIDKWLAAISHEIDALYFTRVSALQLGLKMKINDVEYQGDDSKAVFFYTADERVDFRELIKILAEHLKIRIEMRQIGMRQESSRLGGLGACGRELCCASWISDFHSVSTIAAKVQQLAANPQKLAGQCSKLKCCLNYELEAYQDALKEFPNENLILKTKEGEANLQKIDVFAQLLWFSYQSKPYEFFPLHLKKVNEVIALNKNGKLPDSLSNLEHKTEAKTTEVSLIAPLGEDLHRFDNVGKNKKTKKNKKNFNKKGNKNDKE